MNSQMNANEKRCTPQLRSVFESFSTQLSIGELEKLRSEVKREATSANLSLSSKRVFDELVKGGHVDETNQAKLAEYCRAVSRYDLLTIIGGRRAVPVVDPVEEFIKDRQIAENKHAKKYTLKKQDELTDREPSKEAEYSGPLTRSRKRLHEQQVWKAHSVANANSEHEADGSVNVNVSEIDLISKQMRFDRSAGSTGGTEPCSNGHGNQYQSAVINSNSNSSSSMSTTSSSASTSVTASNCNTTGLASAKQSAAHVNFRSGSQPGASGSSAMGSVSGLSSSSVSVSASNSTSASSGALPGAPVPNGASGAAAASLPIPASAPSIVPVSVPVRRTVPHASNAIPSSTTGIRGTTGTATSAATMSNARIAAGNSSANTSATLIRKKETCDVNLRVRAEYQDHEAALAAAVGSTRETETERQFERFAQANQVLRSRDLGAIVCEIKFSELTYLDAFWRDYINGSLLQALRDVFITESLRQAVNYEQVRLLITVDEDDYEMGRTRLVHNL